MQFSMEADLTLVRGEISVEIPLLRNGSKGSFCF